MEDAHFVDDDFGGEGRLFAGVYDGHGGAYAAEYAAAHLHRRCLYKLSEGRSPEDALVSAYEAVSDELEDQESGTTAATFLIDGHVLTAANAGDARILLIGRKDCQQITVDHRVDQTEERSRIQKQGGRIEGSYVYRGSRGLMPTRSLGDAYFRPVGVIPTPSVRTCDISEDHLFVLAACDGLFDYMNNDEAARLARQAPDARTLAQTLGEEVLYVRMGMDNLTIIAVGLQD